MRPTKNETWLGVAQVVARRSTCLRRAVGCVLVNARGHVLATGYNGRAAGLPHCNTEKLEGRDYVEWAKTDEGGVTTKPQRMVAAHPHACLGADALSGTNLDGCEAIHAEQNALLQCRDVYEIETCYVTVSPCITCVKLLLNTSCRRIVFCEAYAHDAASSRLWFDAGREWHCVRPR